MKKLFYISAVFVLALLSGCEHREKEEDGHTTALLLIDIQDFYFPGGKAELVDPEEAAGHAQKLLKAFRERGMEVVHVRHDSEPGGDIHESVQPVDEEPVFTKRHVNAFRETDLLAWLREREISGLVVCGMMTHMCVEGTVRAAHDHGFNCTVVSDACATRDLSFGEITIEAGDVHHSTLATLKGNYARIMDTENYLSQFISER